MVYKKTGPRARRRARQRSEIKKAALLIIARGGLDALTMQGLATATDFTPGALYRYFVSKTALIGELQRESLELLARALDRSRQQVAGWDIPGEGAEPERVRALARLLTINAVHRALPRLIPERFALLSAILGHMTPLVTEDEARPHIEALAGIVAGIAAGFARAQQAGALEPGDPADRGFIFIAAVQGVFPFARFGRVAPTLTPRFADDDRPRRVARALLRGWGADPTTLTAAEAAVETALGERGAQSFLEDRHDPEEDPS